MVADRLLSRPLGTSDNKVRKRGALERRRPLQQLLLLRCNTRLEALLLLRGCNYHHCFSWLPTTVRQVAVQVKDRQARPLSTVAPRPMSAVDSIATKGRLGGRAVPQAAHLGTALEQLP